MPTPFTNKLALITNGEPVDAGTANRPLSNLSQRTLSLKEQVDNALIGSAVVDREAAIGSDVVIGTPVYRDTTGVYRPAVAEVTLNTVSGAQALSARGQVIGVCGYRYGSNLADVILLGKVRLTAAELVAVSATGAALTGQLFLNAVTAYPGKLVTQRPPVGLPVAICTGPEADGGYTLFVNPSYKDFAADHIHYHARLTNRAAATSTDVGWRPVSDTDAFPDGGPPGAALGYVVAADTYLNDLWPPIPVGACCMELNGVGLELNGDNPRVITDESGIWWMDACVDPYGIDPGSSSSSNSSGDPCYDEVDRLDLWFTKMLFETTSMVTSLDAIDDSVTIIASDGETASTGALRIQSNLRLSEVNDLDSSLAVMDISSNKLRRGPIVSSITPGSTNVTLSGGEVHPTIANARFGNVVVTVDDSNLERDGPIEFLALENAQLQLDEGQVVHHLLLPATPACSLTGRVRIPTAGVSTLGTYALTMTFTLLGKSGGGTPDLTLEYMIVPATEIETVLPSSLDPWPGTAPAVAAIAALTTGKYRAYTTAALTVDPGDLVIFRLTKAAAAAAVGLLDQRWRLDRTA